MLEENFLRPYRADEEALLRHLMCEVLKANGKMPKEFESVAEAHRFLNERRLYQGSLSKRAFKKISTAISFENLRDEGIDPAYYASNQYRMIHNKHSVDPLECRVEIDRDKIAEMTKRALEIYNENNKADHSIAYGCIIRRYRNGKC